MKKFLSLTLALIMLLSTSLALAEGIDYSVTEPTEVVFWHSISNDANIDLLNTMIEDFESQYPLIDIVPEYIGGYNVINTELVAVNAAGVGLPGVAIINVPRLANYGQSGIVEDLTPYIEATNYDLSDFGPGFIDAMNVDGMQVAMPFMQSGQIFFYNKTVCEELNIAFPDQWEDMEAYCRTIYDATGKPAFTVLGADNAYFYCLFCNVGAYMINDDGVTTGLDKPEALDLIKQLYDWKQKGYIDWLVTDAANTGRLNFVTGETMGLLYTSTLYNNYKETAEGFEVGIALPPKALTQYHFVAGGTLIMPAKNDQKIKNAAWEFIKFLTGTKYQLDWAMSTSYFPTRLSAMEPSEKYTQYLELLPEMKNVVEHLEVYVKKTQHPLFDTCGDIFENNLAKIMVEGVDPDTGWAMLVEEMNDYLADQ